ncbi:hypothetical protein BBJ28_00013635, partial [Nothophytophthora sp. Chile5]
GQDANLGIFYDARGVFYKHRAANFYRTASYVLASSLSQIPLAVLESLIFGSLVYWLSGLVHDAGAFLLFELFLMLVILVLAGVFFLLAAVSPNLNIATPIGTVLVLLFVLFAGFIVSKSVIPGWLIWLYWLNPVAWTVRSIAVSQYRSSKLDVCVYEGVDYCTAYGQTMGEYSLGLFDVPTDEGWVVYGIIFLVASYAVLMLSSFFALEYQRYERPEHIALPQEDVEDPESYNLLASPLAASHNASQVSAEVVLGVENFHHKMKVPPVSVAFKDLWYTVTVPGGRGQPTQSLDLLKGITGYALPGSITALMGSTGAGKTTLMDVIAGRKTSGKIQGQILLNGFEASDLSIRRCTGYCEQNDIHSTASTFREALTFSAFMRQDADIPDSHKHDTVAECLELLGLEDIADQIIRGSSMEKMKRLTIGVEMAAQPSVFFLDEPTSGLDARSAKVIMDGVRRVADSGRTVLCTIHQPSADVFRLFDSLLLLKRGGETVYFGDLGHEGISMVEYFESIASVPRITEGYNPATWMLEVIGAGVASQRQVATATVSDNSAALDPQQTSADDVNFVQCFNASANKMLLDDKLLEPGLFQPSEHLEPLNYSNKRAASNAIQLRFLLQRFFVTYWRTPSYNLTRFGIALFLGLIFGFVYLNPEYTTYQGINGGLGMVYLSTVFIALVSFGSGLHLIYEERAAFYRERAAQTYNTVWYFVSFTLVEIPYVFTFALVFVVVYYPMVGFVGLEGAVFYWLNLALMILFQAYLAQLAAFTVPSVEVATVFGVLINSIGLMFMGFNPPGMQIPRGYQWIYDIVPHRYSFSVLVAIVFGGCSDHQLAEIALSTFSASDYPLGCRTIQNAPASVGEVTIKRYVREVFNIRHEHIAQYSGVFLGILLVFRVLTVLAMRFINHQQR